MSKPLYIHITEQCKLEAKNFNLLEQLEKLKARVERDQNLMQFEVFEFPYQVKKYFSYQYRLVTHIDNITYQNKNYRILTFLKIYHRGDKSYEKWYINARQYGDTVYKQRNVAKEIEQFLPQIAQQDNEVEYIETKYQHLLANYRVDILNLAQEPNEYYQETLTWQYDIAPKLSTEQLQKYQRTLFHAMDKHENTYLNFDNKAISGIIPPFKQYEPIIYQAQIHCAMQDNPPWLGLNDEVSTDYHRRVPLELSLDEPLWSLSQQTHLPFRLNPLQQQCIDALFSKYQSYPFVVQADKNTGKTTLLALLYAHFYVQESVENTLPCLFLCEEHEVETLHQSLSAYIQLQQQWHGLKTTHKNLKLDLQKSCLPLKSYLLQHLSNEQKNSFPEEKYIDDSTFYAMYQKYFSTINYPEFQYLIEHSHLVWRVIQYHIKGKLIDNPELNHKLSELLNEEEFQFIYEKIYKNWYLSLQQNQGYWDIQDLIIYIEQCDIPLTPYSTLLCDQAQQYSEIALSLVLKQNYWLNNGYTDQIAQIPLIFMSYDSPEDYIHSWQEQLYRILNEIVQFNSQDSQNPPDLKTIIPYVYQHKISAVTSLFNYYYNRLGLTKHYIRGEHSTPPTPINIYFIHAQQNEFLIPLLQQHHAPWLVYDGQHKIPYPLSLRTQEFNDQFYQQFYQARLVNYSSKLPTKQRSIILSNFDRIIYEIYQYVGHKEQAKSLDRYRLKCLLHDLEIALQQGLQNIIIASTQPENFNLWQSFFNQTIFQNNVWSNHEFSPNQYSPEENYIHFRTIQFNDVEQYYSVHQKDFPEPDKPLSHYITLAKNNQIDKNVVFKRICYYESRFEFNDQFDYEVIFDYAEQQIDSFFKRHKKHKYQYKMIALMLTLFDMENLKKYQNLISEPFKVHFDCLQLMYEKEPSNEWVNDYLDVYERILAQQTCTPDIHSVWYDFWFKVQHELYEKFTRCPEVTQDIYQKLYQKVYYSIQNNVLYSINLWAFLHLKLRKYQDTLQILQNAINQRLIAQYPMFYHEAKIQTLPHIEERLDYLLNFNQDFKKQELLKMNLNELQAEYWEKILQHLYEEDDLEPILSHLLPSITSEDILERLYQFCKMNPDTEAFSKRVRRIKTFWASLSNDWFVIEDRLEKCKPNHSIEEFRQITMPQFHNQLHGKSRQKVKSKANYTFDEELIDMLYALNLSTKIYVPSTQEEWQQYKDSDRVKTTFSLLKNVFSFSKDDDTTWKTGFQSIRALCCLMEKSPDLELPFSLYFQLLHEYGEKDVLYPFFLERLFVVAKRIQIYDAENTELLEYTQRFETKFKKHLQNFNVDDLVLEPPTLKQVSEILKSILAISPQENSVLQQLEREEAKEKERLEAEQLAKEEQKRLEAERIAKEQARLEAERIKEEQERLEAERIAQEEQERLEAERIAQEEHARLEAERIAQEEQARIEAERIAQEEQARIEAERIAQEEQARIEAERFAQEQVLIEAEQQRIAQEQARIEAEQRIAQEQARIEAERIARLNAQTTVQSTTSTTTTNISNTHLNMNPAPLFDSTSRKATTEMMMFGLRIFVSRVHKRINIEDVNTGERWSLHLLSQQVQSDWQYQQQQNAYHIPALRINVIVLANDIQIQYLEYGVSTQIQL